MAKRKIIKIDLEKCNGCGNCVPNCPEGAIQIIDNKARLISDLFCDGLGACIGTCPLNAITIEEREAEPYDERKVMGNIITQGENVIKAHLEHLKEHGEIKFLNIALSVLKEQNITIPIAIEQSKCQGACPGMKTIIFDGEEEQSDTSSQSIPSALRQWPIQLHLVSPLAPYFQKRDILLAADCVAYSIGDFHTKYLKGKSLAIACPKLDSNREVYIDKLKLMIDESEINTLTVMIMEVPCCSGLLMLAKEAASQSKRKIPIKKIVVGLKGEIKEETWV